MFTTSGTKLFDGPTATSWIAPEAARASVRAARSASAARIRMTNLQGEPTVRQGKSSLQVQPAKDLNLSCVIYVVTGDAGHGLGGGPLLPRRKLAEVAGAQPLDDRPQRAVLGAEELQVVAPGGRRGAALVRTGKEVGAGKCEGAPLFAGQPAADRVLPVGGVHGELPDVVPVRIGTEERLVDLDAAKRADQIRTVP